MPKVKLTTNFGDILLQLDEEKAPNTVKNFLAYVESGHYDGTIFHRVIGNFMIQGGGFDKDLSQKSVNAPIECESQNGLTNKTGSIAMARTNDPHSATAQFFINVKDNDFLNFTAENEQGWGYAVFGEVIDGMPVVEKIKNVETGSQQYMQDVPVEAVEILQASVVDEQ